MQPPTSRNWNQNSLEHPSTCPETLRSHPPQLNSSLSSQPPENASPSLSPTLPRSQAKPSGTPTRGSPDSSSSSRASSSPSDTTASPTSSTHRATTYSPPKLALHPSSPSQRATFLSSLGSVSTAPTSSSTDVPLSSPGL